MVEVEIYTTQYCPFCVQAKRLLKKKGVQFKEIDVGAEPHLRQEMMRRADGGHTVPQIFIGGHHVGGCDDLHSLEFEGELDPMLAGETPS